ncbi:MAG: YybH family protein [Actinomycetota bacterium]
MDLDGLHGWMQDYFAAWVSNDPADVAALFTEDAEYRVSPYATPWMGRDEIVQGWTSGRQTEVASSYEPLALQGDRAVVRWNVQARDPDGVRRERDGVLVLTFAPDRRCKDHREWLVIRELAD